MNVPCRDLVAILRIALDNGARVRLTVTGSSMVPFLRNADVVELERVTPLDICPGDILLAQKSDGTYVLHRVFRMGEGRVFMAGDLGREDGWIPLEDVIARARAVLRKGRWVRLDTPSARKTALLWAHVRCVGWPALKIGLKLRGWLHGVQAAAGCDERSA